MFAVKPGVCGVHSRTKFVNKIPYRVNSFRGDDRRTSSTNRQKLRRVGTRSVVSHGKRKREPLDLELIVLFGSVSIILLVPWLLHDLRFICIIPTCLLVVPGLFGIFIEACRDIVDILHSRATSASSKSKNQNDADRDMASFLGRKRKTLSQSIYHFLTKLPWLRYWGGFL